MLKNIEYMRLDRATVVELARKAGFSGVTFDAGNWITVQFMRFTALVQDEVLRRFIATLPELQEVVIEKPVVRQEEWR